MKVILNQDVTGLGEEGDIKDVADGYARNFLLPKKLAVPHTREFLVMLEHKRAAIEKRKEAKRLEAAGLKERLEAEEIRFSVPAGENGKLFGSVNNVNVATELEKKGFAIEKKRIEIPDHAIRSVGTYKVRIRLYDKEEAMIKLVVEGTAQPGSAAPSKPRAPRGRKAEEAAAGEPAPAAAAPADEPKTEPAPEA
ncbi:MAG TPA: 50S ribosomal protein L9 [Spirochaetia bacterium]|nr:50S ribosomal protein L9 [Spirochaetia bacterium]